MTQHTRNNGIVYERLTQQVFQTIIDSEAVRLGLDEAPRLGLSMDPDGTQLFDEFGAQLGTVKEITASCYGDGLHELEPTRVRHEFDKPTFVATGHPDFPKLKLTAIEATIATQSLVQETSINVAELVLCILKDTLHGTVKTFDPQLLERNALEY